MAGDELTNREITRALDELRVEVRGLPDRLERTYLRRDVYEADRRTLAEQLGAILADVAGLLSNQAWITRAVIGAVVLAVLGGVLIARPG